MVAILKRFKLRQGEVYSGPFGLLANGCADANRYPSWFIQLLSITRLKARRYVLLGARSRPELMKGSSTNPALRRSLMKQSNLHKMLSRQGGVNRLSIAWRTTTYK